MWLSSAKQRLAKIYGLILVNEKEEIENIILSFTEFTVNHKFNIGYPRPKRGNNGLLRPKNLDL